MGEYMGRQFAFGDYGALRRDSRRRAKTFVKLMQEDRGIARLLLRYYDESWLIETVTELYFSDAIRKNMPTMTQARSARR